jgi:hypothetical protein
MMGHIDRKLLKLASTVFCSRRRRRARGSAMDEFVPVQCDLVYCFKAGSTAVAKENHELISIIQRNNAEKLCPAEKFHRD